MCTLWGIRLLHYHKRVDRDTGQGVYSVCLSPSCQNCHAFMMQAKMIKLMFDVWDSLPLIQNTLFGESANHRKIRLKHSLMNLPPSLSTWLQLHCTMAEKVGISDGETPAFSETFLAKFRCCDCKKNLRPPIRYIWRIHVYVFPRFHCTLLS